MRRMLLVLLLLVPIVACGNSGSSGNPDIPATDTLGSDTGNDASAIPLSFGWTGPGVGLTGSDVSGFGSVAGPQQALQVK